MTLDSDLERTVLQLKSWLLGVQITPIRNPGRHFRMLQTIQPLGLQHDVVLNIAAQSRSGQNFDGPARVLS